ncbi:MAG: hypothetical protein K2W96_04725 [Gemmataceae bacterium]|nr:hypothetical protein [Gemmataceae bacterium]
MPTGWFHRKLLFKAVAAAGPLANRVRNGDVFVSVDGVAVKDADGLRRALRKRFAIGGVGRFVVRRGGEEVAVRAVLGE